MTSTIGIATSPPSFSKSAHVQAVVLHLGQIPCHQQYDHQFNEFRGPETVEAAERDPTPRSEDRWFRPANVAASRARITV